MELNSAKSSNNISETTGQVLMKVGYHDHLVVGISILFEKGIMMTVVLVETCTKA